MNEASLPPRGPSDRAHAETVCATLALVALVALVRLLTRARIAHLAAEVLFIPRANPHCWANPAFARPRAFWCHTATRRVSTSCLAGITPGVPHIVNIQALPTPERRGTIKRTRRSRIHPRYVRLGCGHTHPCTPRYRYCGAQTRGLPNMASAQRASYGRCAACWACAVARRLVPTPVPV